MIQRSPDTPSRPPGGGYSVADSSLTGLSLTHVSGPGCAIGGVTPIAVATLAAGTFIPTGSGTYAVGFSPDGATAWAVDSDVHDAVPITVATGAVGTAVTVGAVPDGVTVTG